ncbi:hypothetical protein BD410DRAFT_375058 [Rickenella mellea]|uniref:Crinkler effector protein N-terminal domain-containing protein n=1 Tax=Rickenella mellea TaxID=50990 RepID=A0A4Y7Q0E8_9AGAM|nr:hypothetical protein BD410DRAFT_375058 [Rickenella mellea]
MTDIIVDVDLWCFILGDKEPFPVSVPIDKSIGALKKLVWEEGKNSILKGFDAKDLTIHTLNVEVLVKPPGTIAERIAEQFLVRRETTDPVSTTFPSPVRDRQDILHFVAVRPFVPTHVRQLSPEEGLSLRTETVSRLYTILKQYKIIHARGTPGVGKTTLRRLIHRHIRSCEPHSMVFLPSSWPSGPSSIVDELNERLMAIDPEYPNRPWDDPAFILFDEAQDTYVDGMLWNILFKDIQSYPYYVVLFCSYGSPSDRVVDHRIGTPLDLDDESRVSLLPTHCSPGLLLTEAEYVEVVDRFYPSMNLARDLRETIFLWTAGYVGAVRGVLEMISRFPDRKALRQGAVVDLAEFDRNCPPSKFHDMLRGPAFKRGLPKGVELSKPPIMAVVKRLLLDGAIEIQSGQECDALRSCHSNGWVISSLVGSKALPPFLRYEFPSPLHISWVSHMTTWTNQPLPFADAFELVVTALLRFRPSQLSLPPRRIGPGPDPPPEAQYQQELYRGLHEAANGNVIVSPEFASSKGALVAGRIDFFVPQVKWGIEVTRDGSRLQEHSDRFQPQGAYGSWLGTLDMNDYILLDCRRNKPRDTHTGIPNLYHAVFGPQFSEVTVYNNNLDIVHETTGLLEHHYE